jgi:hypothetical protein
MIQYNLPLKIVSYKELYGWTMDEIVECIGNKNNCKILVDESNLRYILRCIPSSSIRQRFGHARNKSHLNGP